MAAQTKVLVVGMQVDSECFRDRTYVFNGQGQDKGSQDERRMKDASLTSA